MKQHHVQVHSAVPPGQSALPPDHLARREQAAVRLFKSLLVPPKTSWSTSPWGLENPVEPLSHSRTYTSGVPDFLSPQKLSKESLRAPSAALDDRGFSPPSFAHWRPSPPPLAASSTHPPPQTQGILGRRRGNRASTTVDASLQQKRGKKKVRVESPAEQRGLRRSSRIGEKVIVPATPTEVEEIKLPTQAKEQPELGKGALQRCIPYPYANAPSLTCLNPNPTRQHPSLILHSFVDPSFRRTTSSASSASLSLIIEPSALTTSPTYSFLSPGRRGSWLIPISGPFPLPHASPPKWFASPPPPSSSARQPKNKPRSDDQPKPRAIEWTSARLRALWAALDALHGNTHFGSLRATCHIPPSLSPPSLASNVSGSDPSPAPKAALPEYLKVSTDAHLALALRGALDQVTVKGLLQDEEGASEQDRGDGETWLRGRGLVWVDEAGRAVLVA
ncbi:hypothetical protein JCM1841_004356 [Sporobolomyces salmonicolor]